MGWLSGDRLVCAYHGWQYDSSGACVRIPSLPPERGIPNKARATGYRVAERDGLVWVCLGDPVADPPQLSAEFDDPTFRWTRRTVDVAANAARFMENGMDQSHFAFVHAGIIAVDPEVDPITVEPIDGGFAYEVSNPLNTLKPGGARERTRYRVILPFTLLIEKFTDTGERRQIVFVGSPVDGKHTRVFRFLGMNFHRLSDEEEDARQQTIFEQDRAVVEAQRPEELPLDLREELHLRGPDAAALEYRRALSRLGVEWG
jgi:vanillate O-demethylase monooxygenase subunit